VKSTLDFADDQKHSKGGDLRYAPRKTSEHPTLQGELPFVTSIADSREDSIKEAKSASEEIQVFTDGSALNRKVGAAAILTREGKPPCVLHLTLGPKSEHTVHEAELVRILLGMHLISTESHGSTTFAMGVDNQAAISTFHSALRNPGHHLAREILQVANRTQKCRQKGRYKLTICWTAGHKGIKGNKDTDRKAKRAAEGLTSDKRNLPPYIRKTPSLLFHAFHAFLCFYQ